MANIASSLVVQASPQKDGTQTVHESHTDLAGLVHDLVYQAAAGDDLNVNLARHASDLGQSLDDSEVQTNISNVLTLGSLAVPTFVYSTAAENVAALRTAYQTATQLQAVLTGDFLNTLTNGQLAAAFNITTGQAATLRTNKLAPAASLASSIRTQVGQ